jgi:hypothetical protein
MTVPTTETSESDLRLATKGFEAMYSKRCFMTGFILVRKKLLEVMPTKQQHAPAALKRPLERRSLLTLGGVA